MPAPSPSTRRSPSMATSSPVGHPKTCRRSAGPSSASSQRVRTHTMSVTAFQDLPLADRDREWDGGAAEKRVREWAKATDEPNQEYRDAHVWYDAEKMDNYTAYKLLIADVAN